MIYILQATTLVFAVNCIRMVLALKNDYMSPSMQLKSNTGIGVSA